MSCDARRTLVLGGARSGKSAFAESLLRARCAGQTGDSRFADDFAADYLATAAAAEHDPEWAARVAAHRARRPQTWRTLESDDLAGVLGEHGRPLLIDSVTAWLARTMDSCGYWDRTHPSSVLAESTTAVCAAWAATDRYTVAVSDEVGLGVVPDTAAGRQFRDELGTLNQRLAADADAVYLVVAGLPVQLR